MHVAAFLLARTVGFGEAIVLAVVITVVVVASLIALRHRTDGDA